MSKVKVQDEFLKVEADFSFLVHCKHPMVLNANELFDVPHFSRSQVISKSLLVGVVGHRSRQILKGRRDLETPARGRARSKFMTDSESITPVSQ